MQRTYNKAVELTAHSAHFLGSSSPLSPVGRRSPLALGFQQIKTASSRHLSVELPDSILFGIVKRTIGGNTDGHSPRDHSGNRFVPRRGRRSETRPILPATSRHHPTRSRSSDYAELGRCPIRLCFNHCVDIAWQPFEEGFNPHQLDAELIGISVETNGRQRLAGLTTDTFELLFSYEHFAVPPQLSPSHSTHP